MAAAPDSNVSQAPDKPLVVSAWSAHYGDRHKLHRLTDFPAGIRPPERVRIYWRYSHYILQWWDPPAKGNLCERVDGDLLTALARARQIDERLVHFRSSGQVRHHQLSHDFLVESFLADLRQRADAGEIDPATVHRYASALRHYLAFCTQPLIAKGYAKPTSVNRDFRLKLTAFLAQRQVTPNGRLSRARPMKGQLFVLQAIRALYQWAADPDRGGLLPDGFRSPFLRCGESRSVLKGDPLAEPEITVSMSIDFVRACDRFQLRLFVPMLLFGLRAAEPCYLFAEYLDDSWLAVPCNSNLDYRTKGRRDKRFPLLGRLAEFWHELRDGLAHGLLYRRRAVAENGAQAPLDGSSLPQLVSEYRRRCSTASALSAGEKQKLRNHLLHDAGGLSYDHIQGEFAGLAQRLGWPRAATLKDLRHLFATTMNNAAMPEGYRRYLMGQSPGNAAILAYTHLNELQRHYAEAVEREWGSLLNAIKERLRVLSGPR